MNNPPSNVKETVQGTPAFFRPNEAAQYVRLSRRHLSTLTRRGVFAVSRLGHRVALYSKADLDAGILRFRRAAVGERRVQS